MDFMMKKESMETNLSLISRFIYPFKAGESDNLEDTLDYQNVIKWLNL